MNLNSLQDFAGVGIQVEAVNVVMIGFCLVTFGIHFSKVIDQNKPSGIGFFGQKEKVRHAGCALRRGAIGIVKRDHDGGGTIGADEEGLHLLVMVGWDRAGDGCFMVGNPADLRASVAVRIMQFDFRMPGIGGDEAGRWQWVELARPGGFRSGFGDENRVAVVERVIGHLQLAVLLSDDDPGVEQFVQIYLDDLVGVRGSAGTDEEEGKNESDCSHKRE